MIDQANSKNERKYSTMANFNCHVRIYVPLKSDGSPATSQSGRYDLQIDSIGGATLNFDSHTKVVNPVFSYTGFSGDGYVRIFNEAKTTQVYDTGHYLLCKFDFTATAEKVTSFIKTLQGMLNYSSYYSNNDCSVYRVTAEPFDTYLRSSTNSFAATAVWCNMLGLSALYDIYNSSSDYTDYDAWELFDQLYTAWSFEELT